MCCGYGWKRRKGGLCTSLVLVSTADHHALVEGWRLSAVGIYETGAEAPTPSRPGTLSPLTAGFQLAVTVLVRV